MPLAIPFIPLLLGTIAGATGLNAINRGVDNITTPQRIIPNVLTGNSAAAPQSSNGLRNGLLMTGAVVAGGFLAVRVAGRLADNLVDDVLGD